MPSYREHRNGPEHRGARGGADAREPEPAAGRKRVHPLHEQLEKKRRHSSIF